MTEEKLNAIMRLKDCHTSLQFVKVTNWSYQTISIAIRNIQYFEGEICLLTYNGQKIFT